MTALARRTHVSLASVLLLGLAACSQPEKPPVDGLDGAAEPVKTGLSNIQVVTSDHGIEAWLVSEPSIPIIAINMAWPGGDALDPADKTGATGLMTYMMNEGAGDLDSKAFATRMEELNMSFGCSSSEDWTSCSMRTLSENTSAAMDLVRMGLTETRFDDAPFERSKRESLVALARAETNPDVLAGRAMQAALYPDHPYARYATEETVTGLTREDLIESRDRVMAKDTMLVTVVGDITPDELEAMMTKTFADLPEESSVPEIADVTLSDPADDPLVTALPQPQSLISFTAPGLKREDPDFIPAYVVNYILGGGGFSARMMDEIREKRGLTYGIYTSLGASRHLGTWGGSTQTENKNAGEMIGRVKAELAKMAQDGPTEAELGGRKSLSDGCLPAII